MNAHLLIRTCRHILPHGRRCQGAAVRGRACCRHHLDARARLHNMARARRLTAIPRIRPIETPRDLARNRAELNRVVATGLIDFDTARVMFWALDLAATTFRDEAALRRQRIDKSNGIYHVPASPLFERSYGQDPSEVLENTSGTGVGVHYAGRWRQPAPQKALKVGTKTPAAR